MAKTGAKSADVVQKGPKLDITKGHPTVGKHGVTGGEGSSEGGQLDFLPKSYQGGDKQRVNMSKGSMSTGGMKTGADNSNASTTTKIPFLPDKPEK